MTLVSRARAFSAFFVLPVLQHSYNYCTDFQVADRDLDDSCSGYETLPSCR
ncbi:hypothetical protein ANO14919_081020 [Xylariales sp. No.14919]|nr:hypothetical protein ANO14919_081020 [Xylariales sp. No.14919]